MGTNLLEKTTICCYLIVYIIICIFFVSCTGKSVPESNDALVMERLKKNATWANDPVSPFTAVKQVDLKAGMKLALFFQDDSLVIGYPLQHIEQSLIVFWSPNEKSWLLEANSVKDFVVNKTSINDFKNIQRGRAAYRHYYAPYDPEKVYSFRGYYIKIYANGPKGRLMVFDPKSPARSSFTGLRYFDPDPVFRVEADITWIEDSEVITMPTTLRKMKSYKRLAKLAFTLNNQTCNLTLFGPASGASYGFLPFTDVTNGSLTYGGGRYIELDSLPDPHSKSMFIDFNLAFNPYCAYSPYYNCPIVPAENDLMVEVFAGEKAYK